MSVTIRDVAKGPRYPGYCIQVSKRYTLREQTASGWRGYQRAGLSRKHHGQGFKKQSPMTIGVVLASLTDLFATSSSLLQRKTFLPRRTTVL